MSMEFTAVLASSSKNIADVPRPLLHELDRNGFRRDGAFVRAGYDPERGVFDEADDAQEVIGLDELESKLEPAGDWRGFAVEFLRDGTTFYLLVVQVRQRVLSCWVDVSARSLSRLFRSDDQHRFYAFLCAAARACEAAGGFGDLDLDFAPILPDQVVPAIRDNPQRPGATPWLGILPTALFPEKQVHEFAGDEYRVLRSPIGFWILEANELVDFCSR